MLDTRIRDYLRDKIKREFLLGKRTETPVIPTDAQLNAAIDAQLQASDNGIIGDTAVVAKKSVSDHEAYNASFTTVKDNIEYLLGDTQDLINKILDTINNATLEKNSAVRELRMAGDSFDEIEAGRLRDGGLSYVISDSFNDLSRVDMARTTADVNLNAGVVTIKQATANQLQFPHYKSVKSMAMLVTEGKSYITSERQIPGTTFGGIFDANYDDRYEYVITTSEPTTVSAYFTLKLSELGEAVEVNEVILRLASLNDVQSSEMCGTVHLEYLSIAKDDRNWYRVPGGISDLTKNEIDFRFLIPATTHLKFVFTKEWPDVSDKNEYRYGIIEIAVKKTTTAYESVLVTKSMEIESYHREDISIFSTMLDADHAKVPGATVRYYIGIDDVIPGKIVDRNNSVVDIDSMDAYALISNGMDAAGHAENYYTYASQLRDRIWISGAASFERWTPEWQEITPLYDRLPAVPTARFFNTSMINQNIHDLSFLVPYTFGDAGFIGPWPAIDYTGTWADDWDGTAGGAPKSGYIWGENPFAASGGIWWGDGANEMPGWWRPHLPDRTWQQNWTDEVKSCSPDFAVPVFNTNGRVTYIYNIDTKEYEPAQKQYWKIFKWPKGYLPIPGTIKLFAQIEDKTSQSYSDGENKQTWKWNFKSKQGVKDYTYTFALKENTHFQTIKLEDLIEDTAELSLVKDSVTNLRFKNFTPGEVADYFVDYGYDYILQDDGLLKRFEPESSLIDAHATVTFNEALQTYLTITGDKTPEMSIDFKYVSRDDIEASWETFIYVPDTTPAGTARGHITDASGMVRKMIIDTMDDYGIVTATREILPGRDLSDFPIDYGWSKVRVFVGIDLTQAGKVDSTIAGWNPSTYTIQYAAKGYVMQGINNDTTLRNKFQTTNVNFTASGIVEGLQIDVHSQENADSMTLTTYDGYITKIEGDTIHVAIPDYPGEHKILEWYIPTFTKKAGFTHENVEMGSKIRPMQQVDLHTLMYETSLDNDQRFAVVEDTDTSQYAVVKTPDREHFPKGLINKSHYTRTYHDTTTDTYVTFTTGTKGNNGGHPAAVLDTIADTTTPYLDDRPPNSDAATTYPNISTYGYTMQVSNLAASGFLFWDTAENLQTFYRIEYALPLNSRPNNRLLMMAVLTADAPNVTPTINGYSLIVNGKESESKGM